MAVKLIKTLVFITIAAVVSILPGCSQDKEEEPVTKTEVKVKPNLPPAETTIKGKVVEVVNSGNFVYIRLDRDGKEIWATAPAVALEIGEEITLVGANIFNNFYSNSMKRSFDELIFANAVIQGKQAGKSVSEIHPAPNSLSAGQ